MTTQYSSAKHSNTYSAYRHSRRPKQSPVQQALLRLAPVAASKVALTIPQYSATGIRRAILTAGPVLSRPCFCSHASSSDSHSHRHAAVSTVFQRLIDSVSDFSRFPQIQTSTVQCSAVQWLWQRMAAINCRLHAQHSSTEHATAQHSCCSQTITAKSASPQLQPQMQLTIDRQT